MLNLIIKTKFYIYIYKINISSYIDNIIYWKPGRNLSLFNLCVGLEIINCNKFIDQIKHIDRHNIGIDNVIYFT